LEGLPINQKAISRIETGDRVVADYELMLLAKVLRVGVDALLEKE
jgi:conserved domain protein